jgi:hypothetical protein
MSWIDPTLYNQNDVCSLCAQRLGVQQGIYRISPCNHTFHNDCLNNHCEARNGEIRCPDCSGPVDENLCMNVYAFNKGSLRNQDNEDTLFNGNFHITEIYNNNVNRGIIRRNATANGNKMPKKTKKTKKRLSKAKRTKTRFRKYRK